MPNLSGGVTIHSFQFNPGATYDAEQHSRGSVVKRNDGVVAGDGGSKH